MDTDTEKKRWKFLALYLLGFVDLCCCFFFPISQILKTSVKIFTELSDSSGLGRAYAAIAKILVR